MRSNVYIFCPFVAFAVFLDFEKNKGGLAGPRAPLLDPQLCRVDVWPP